MISSSSASPLGQNERPHQPAHCVSDLPFRLSAGRCLMTLILDPVASLKRQTLVFRNEARPEREIAPHLGRALPTGGYLFNAKVQERLAQIAGLTFAHLLPAGGSPPHIDIQQIGRSSCASNTLDLTRRHAPALRPCGAQGTPARRKRNRWVSSRSSSSGSPFASALRPTEKRCCRIFTDDLRTRRIKSIR